MLYDVTTLYFETHDGDGFREPAFSKERRLEPQITVGLLTDAAGFPLMIEAFEGNKAETHTMLPTTARSWPHTTSRTSGRRGLREEQRAADRVAAVWRQLLRRDLSYDSLRLLQEPVGDRVAGQL